MTKSEPTQKARFSIRDLLVVVGLIGVVLAVSLPFLQATREASRRMSCSNQLKQLGFALHNYHSAFKVFPTPMGGTGVGLTPQHANANRLSGLVALLPFIESAPYWNEVCNPMHVAGTNYPPMGPVPWDKQYPPWQMQHDWFVCPTDGNANRAHPKTNYLFSAGDHTVNIHLAKPQEPRGMFLPRMITRITDVKDGLSNTIMMMETATARSRRVAGQFVINVPKAKLKTPQDCFQYLSKSSTMNYAKQRPLSDLGRGGNWADGAGGYSLVHTIFPPGGPSAAVEATAPADGIFSASSRHAGGCHVAMADGAVVFITETIDNGSIRASFPTGRGPSPYGVLGALGTRWGEEGDVGFMP